MYNKSSISGNDILQDLVNKDTDGDSVLDWEEGLWGTDPGKKDTDDDGTLDGVEITGLKSETADSEENAGEAENLTQTDKFARELFSTITTLNQAGEIDEATIEKLSSSLAEQIQNSVPKKVFNVSEINILDDNTQQATQNYNNTLESIFKKYPINTTVLDVLQKFIIDENNVDTSVLIELDPIIEQTKKVIEEMVKIKVPQFLASSHLSLINAFQRLVENVVDIRLYDTDIILSLSAISQYETNTNLLESALNNLGSIIDKKLNN